MAKKIIYDAKSGKKTILETNEECVVYSTELQIRILKQQLADTDYQAIKYAEGQLSDEEYAPIREQRQAWRDEINKLEVE